MLVMGRTRGYKRFDKVGEGIGQDVNYYAHTAVRSDGTLDQVAGSAHSPPVRYGAEHLHRLGAQS
jgi:hypothetical protein